ncbi:kynurenine 3-monooxygenase [Acrasis kona]|uniref:Kynurenine 3-monooxygenase n=1 Tax=Acrasis kona TaxID=1008807 RepID=A0AAW2Z097_9EUKA
MIPIKFCVRNSPTQVRLINIAIVGAGTAGCASALFLSKYNQHKVSIFERVEKPYSVGAGLLLQPTGMYALNRLGLLDEVKQKGTQINRLRAETSKGRGLFDIKYSMLHPDAFGLGIHRGELFQHLYNAVTNNKSIKVLTNTHITNVEQTDGKVVLNTTGVSQGPFDLVIAADGARSHLCRTNPLLMTLTRRHRVYPWGTLWFVVKDPENKFGDTLHQTVQGTKKMLGILPNGYHDGERVVSVFWSVPTSIKDTWRKTLDIEALKNEICCVQPLAKPLVDQLHSIDQLTFADYYDTILENPYHGRVVVVGDACHAMSPQLGNGANLALWDSMVLSTFLQNNDTVEQALKGFAAERKPHVRFYGMCSRMLTPYFQSNSKVLGWGRDAFMGPFSSIPFVGKQMATVLSGVKRGVINKYDERTLVQAISGRRALDNSDHDDKVLIRNII